MGIMTGEFTPTIAQFHPAKGHVSKDLTSFGFIRGTADDLLLPVEVAKAFNCLQCDAKFLPLDTTAKASIRRRRYGKLYWHPWNNLFEIAPNTIHPVTGDVALEYTQPAVLNRDAEGRRRFFSPLRPETYRNMFLRSMVEVMGRASVFTQEELSVPVLVGIHLIQLQASPGQPSVVSPPHVHRDGEPYTWAMLLERTNALGGQNYVTTSSWAGSRIEDVPSSDIKATFTLLKPMDWYAVKDDVVAHHVDAVTVAEGFSKATRTMLLIDFTPMRPALVM